MEIKVNPTMISTKETKKFNVDVEADKKLKNPVTLEQIKKNIVKK